MTLICSKPATANVERHNRLAVVRKIDLAKDLAGVPGDVIALTADEMIECQCCGRKVRHVYVMETGHKLGSECAGWLETPVYRMGRKPAKKLAALAASLGIRF